MAGNHTHTILLDGYQDRVVPEFEHAHDNSQPGHIHFIVEDDELIPSHVLAFWDARWERWPKSDKCEVEG